MLKSDSDSYWFIVTPTCFLLSSSFVIKCVKNVVGIMNQMIKSVRLPPAAVASFLLKKQALLFSLIYITEV